MIVDLCNGEMRRELDGSIKVYCLGIIFSAPGRSLLIHCLQPEVVYDSFTSSVTMSWSDSRKDLIDNFDTAAHTAYGIKTSLPWTQFEDASLEFSDIGIKSPVGQLALTEPDVMIIENISNIKILTKRDWM